MGAMKKLLALILLTPFIQSNPAGAWRDDMYDSSYSYGGGTVLLPMGCINN